MTSAIGADGGRRWLAALMRPEIMGIDLRGPAAAPPGAGLWALSATPSAHPAGVSVRSVPSR